MGNENTKLSNPRFSVSNTYPSSPPFCLGFPQLPTVFHEGSSGCPQDPDIYSPSSPSGILHCPWFRRFLTSHLSRQSQQAEPLVSHKPAACLSWC